MEQECFWYLVVGNNSVQVQDHFNYSGEKEDQDTCQASYVFKKKAWDQKYLQLFWAWVVSIVEMMRPVNDGLDDYNDVSRWNYHW